MKVNNPHDGIFGDIESDPINSSDLIQGTVDKELVSKLDLKTLQLQNTTYVTEELKKFFSDLVFTCNYGNRKIRLALLFEHKSYFVEYPHIQLLQYMSNILTKTLQEKQSKKDKKEPRFMITIPIVFYHGEKKWEMKDFYKYFELEDEELKGLRQFIPEFNYILTNINKYSRKEIETTLFKRDINKVLMSLLRLNKSELTDEVLLERILSIGKDYFMGLDNDIELKSILVYILNVFDIQQDKIIDILHRIMKGKEDLVMTTAMRLREKGIREDKEVITTNMLKDGLDYNFIHKYTELPVKDIKEIETKLRLLK